MKRYAYARSENSKGGAAAFKPESRDLLFASCLALAPFACLPLVSWLAIIPVLAVNGLLGRYFYRHIGGYTGDCLGTSQQVAEKVFYLSVGAIWTFI